MMRDRTHRHRCLACGAVWEHGAECAGSEDAHACPRCYRPLPEPWGWYRGDELPAVEQVCHGDTVVVERRQPRVA